MAFGVLFLLASVVFFTTPGVFQHKAAGDGWWYYAQTRSLWMDGDLDFTNEASSLPWAKTRHPATGRIPNPYPLGAPVLWSPFFLVARLVVWITGAESDHRELPGFDPTTVTITMWGSLVWAFLGLVLCFLFLRRQVSDRLAFWVTISVFFASSLALFSLLQPSYSHACSFFSVALLVWYWDRTQSDETLKRWAILGALVGLAALVRAQNVLFALIPAVEIFGLAVRNFRASEPRRVWRLFAPGAVASLVALAVFAPQMAAWNYWYGLALTVPQGPGYMVWSRINPQSLLGSLFWARNGMIPWHPILGISLLGLAWRALRRDRLAMVLTVAFLAQWWVNASTVDLWAGWSFGNRRFINCLPALALGLAFALTAAHQWLDRFRRLLPAAVLSALVLTLVVLNVGLMVRVGSREQLVARNFDMRRVYLGATERVLDGIWRVFGNPAAFPAPIIYWLLYDLPVERFDRVVGRFLLQQRPGKQVALTARMDFAASQDQDLLLEHGPIDSSGAAGRVPSHNGRFAMLVPLWFQRAPVRAELSLDWLAPGSEVALFFNDELVARAPASQSSVRLTAEIPAGEIRWGINNLSLAGTPEFEVTGVRFFVPGRN